LWRARPIDRADWPRPDAPGWQPRRDRDGAPGPAGPHGSAGRDPGGRYSRETT